MAELQEIIQTLKSKYVVLIENDLQFETNPVTVIAKFCSLTDFQKVRLLTTLTNIGKDQTAKKLEEFKRTFDQLQHNQELFAALLPEDLEQYLKEMNSEAILTSEFIETLKSDMADPAVNEALLRNGIYRLNDMRYDALLNELKQVAGIEFAFYRSKPVQAELEIFVEDLKYGLLHTESLYYLAVVDKMLGEGQDESGKAFIEVDLVELNKHHQLNSLAFLFTSQPNPSQPADYKDYFVREVQKGSDEVVRVIAGYLTDTSYATVLKNFETTYIEASKKAFEIALKNQQNVKHVIRKSINEGISPFDSLRGWFDQIVQHNIDVLQIENIGYHASLTNFFDEQSLIDHDGIKEYGPDLEKLNSFELFDYNINKKGLPIFPGDIFFKNGEYYILVGQVCDLLIRDTGKRGAKIAEFLKLKVVTFPEDEHEKFSVTVDKKGKKDVLIQHFFDFISESYGVASIEISSKNTYYGDFSTLDLCYTNKQGNSELVKAELGTYELAPWLSGDRKSYLERLHNYFISNKEQLAAVKGVIDLETIIFSASDFTEDEAKIYFGFARISRLKGRFYDSLYQQLINYKARIDLNLIDQAIETSKVVDVVVKYGLLDTSETVRVTLKRRKPSKSFIDAKEVATKVSNFFKASIHNSDTYIEGHKSKEYSFTSIEGGYLLELPIQYKDKNTKLKTLEVENLRFARLFNGTLENKKFKLLDTNEELELNDDGEINITHIQRGVLLLQNNTILKLNDGTVQKEKAAE